MDKKKLIDILLELRYASMQIHENPIDENWHETMRKYNMLFLGEKFNKILSLELAHSLNTVFKINIEADDLNIIIPEVCDSLHMQYDPLIDAKNVGTSNPPIATYDITLW